MPASGDLCSLLISWLTCWLDIHTTACVIQLGCANYKTYKTYIYIYTHICTKLANVKRPVVGMKISRNRIIHILETADVQRPYRFRDRIY